MRLPGIRLSTAVAIIIGCGLFVGMPLLDYDYFWHLETGRWIVTHGWTLPQGEPFSFTVAGSHWVVQGWLFDALQYVAYREFGDTGVRAMFALLNLAAWVLVYAAIRLYLANEARALLVTVLCASAAAPFLAARPLAATNLAFAFVLYALLRHRAGRGVVWLASIPPVFALWINLHFAYVTGLALIGLFAAAAFLERWIPIDGAPREPGRLGPAASAVLFAASVAALLLNPYGWDAVTETFRMTGVNMYTDIADWLSPDFRQPQLQLFLLVPGLLFFGRALAARRAQWLDLLTAFAMTGAALHSQRHIPLACIALAPMIARAFAAWSTSTVRNALPTALGRRWAATGGKDIGDAQYLVNLGLASAAVAAAFVLQPVVARWQEARLRFLLPAAAADFVEKHRLEGPMIHDYHTGGYLIHRLHPRVPVFVDGRYNPYEGAPLRDHDRAIEARSGWQEVLERRGIRLAILTLPHDRLATAMIESGRFRLVHAEGLYGVLIRNDGSRRDLPTVRTGASLDTQ